MFKHRIKRTTDFIFEQIAKFRHEHNRLSLIYSLTRSLIYSISLSAIIPFASNTVTSMCFVSVAILLMHTHTQTRTHMYYIDAYLHLNIMIHSIE